MADGAKTSDPCVMVIFGATGDLMKRKLLPALYNLAKEDFLPHKFAIIGVGRQEMSSEDFRKMVRLIFQKEKLEVSPLLEAS